MRHQQMAHQQMTTHQQMTVENPNAAARAIAVQILERTKSDLAEFGWVQRIFNTDGADPQTARCLLVALARADVAVCSEALGPGDHPLPSAAEIFCGSELASKRLGNLVPYGMLMTYNDTVGRTVEDIYRLIDTAIKDINLVSVGNDGG